MARFFINRPVVAMVISILMVIIGLVAIAAGGAHKEHAIRAALRASAAKVLITDEGAAEALLAGSARATEGAERETRHGQ